MDDQTEEVDYDEVYVLVADQRRVSRNVRFRIFFKKILILFSNLFWFFEVFFLKKNQLVYRRAL